MRAAVWCVLALVALSGVMASTGVSADESAEMDENMSADDFDRQPFVPHATEHDEVADDDAIEETQVSDEESDVQDQLEGNTEFEGASFIEADAAAAASASANAAADAAAGSDAAAAVESEEERKKHKGIVRAPAPLKAAPFKFHAERVSAQTAKGGDPELAKLDLALAAVKEDILSTNKQITDERKWVIAVAKIIASYNAKLKRVEAHIIALRKEMKALYRKKKQIENLKLQKALESKLKEARAELQTLMDSLKHVDVKKGELNKSGSALRQTIAGIQAQLAKLRGQSMRKRKGNKKCAKGKRFSRKLRKCVKKGKGKGRKSRKGKAHKRR